MLIKVNDIIYDDGVTSREDWRALYSRLANGTFSGQVTNLQQPKIHCLTCILCLIGQFLHQDSVLINQWQRKFLGGGGADWEYRISGGN